MRLLLVEDDTELSTSLHTRLKREGFAVDIASNGDRRRAWATKRLTMR